MGKLTSKKVKVFGRDVSVMLIAMVAVMGFAAAALIPYFGILTGTATVDQGLYLDDHVYNSPVTEDFEVSSLSAQTSRSNPAHVLHNKGSVEGIFNLTTACSTSATNCIGVDTHYEYPLLALNTANNADGLEDRVVISPQEAGVTDLNSFNSMSWDALVASGYLPHVDLYLDTNGDGAADDALVFEYAKVSDTACDGRLINNDGDYPQDEINTFGEGLAEGDKGIIDGSAKAWLASGVPGGCTTQEFMDKWHTLDQWKSGASGIDGTDAIVRIELEIDNWIPAYSAVDHVSTVDNIMVNNAPVEGSFLADGETLDFVVVYEFAQLLEPGTYTIDTTVDAVIV